MFYCYLTLMLLSHTNVLLITSFPLILKEKVQSILDETQDGNDFLILQSLSNFIENDTGDVPKNKNPIKNTDIAQSGEKLKNYMETYDSARNILPSSVFTNQYRINRPTLLIDPALNSIKHRRLWERKASSSSDVRLKTEDWPDKRMAQNAISVTEPRGGVVNVVARLRGLKCVDLNERDNFWGTCKLPEECDENNRIYRGDKICDKHICCARTGTYDKYQGLDSSRTGFERETDTSDKTTGKEKLTSHQQMDPLRPAILDQIKTLVDVDKIESDVVKIESDVEKIESELEKLESDVEKLESKLENMESNSEMIKRKAETIESDAEKAEREPEIKNHRHFEYDIVVEGYMIEQ